MSTDLLTVDDFWDDIHGAVAVGESLSIEDTRLSVDVPIVVSYELADLDKTAPANLPVTHGRAQQ